MLDFWEVRYKHDVTPWDRGRTSPALMGWLDQPGMNPCRILVPGCGRGYEVAELAGRGFDVVGLDISPYAIDTLRKGLDHRGLSAELIVGDVLKWTPEVPFDAVYEQTCLCALLPSQWPAYARQLARWLRPGGRLYALFMQTGKQGGPPFDCPVEKMESLFSANDWMWSDWPPSRVSHPKGMHELATVLHRR